MIKPYRKAVRDQIKAILENQETGFNARHAELAAAYGVEPYVINFAPGSRSFFQGAISPESSDFDFSSVFPQPLGLVLYTQSAVNTKDQNSGFFAGQVEARLDFYLQKEARNREDVDRMEEDDCETIVDAIEEAAMQALNAEAAAWGSVVYNLDFRTERGDLKLVGTGWQQRMTILLVCGVYL